MPEVELKTRKNKEKFMESVGWAVNTDCKEVNVLMEGFSQCVCPRVGVFMLSYRCLTGLDICNWCSQKR